MNDAATPKYSIRRLQGTQAYWRSLYYFNLYRLLLGTGMLTMAVSGSDVAVLGRDDPLLFLLASACMLAVAITSLITITISWPSFRIQAYLQFSMDALLITAMSHASGGVESGLNLLLIASVAAGGVVLSGRMSLFFAAFATVLALLQHTFEVLLTAVPGFESAFVQVGVLGIAYFSTGWIVFWLARRFHAIEAQAEATQATTARLDRLNEAIVSKSTVGIVVISNDSHCRLINDQARLMLGLPEDDEAIPAELSKQALAGASEHNAFSFDYRSPVTRIKVQGIRIDDQDNELALFLEDLAETEREARNLKLAALGRLTASVAHEIRNPLEAISHAGQLLAESPELTGQNHKLTRIIDNQTNRINNIVTSILQLGKPGSVQRISLDVGTWLQRFAEHFNAAHGLDDALAVECGTGLTALVDPDQLNQILSNLCENALRHTRHLGDRPLITVECALERRGDAVQIDITDRGRGVSEEVRDKIFEPFFTTDHRGLGLGLFLARELAHNNYGELDYIHTGGAGCFRLLLESAPRSGAAASPKLMYQGDA